MIYYLDMVPFVLFTRVLERMKCDVITHVMTCEITSNDVLMGREVCMYH